MRDLINRQEAIDTIGRLFPVSVLNEYTDGITCGVALALNYIKQLPPAEPEEPETRPISFEDYCVALEAMRMDGIVTNEEYKRIMAKVIAHEKAERRKE